MAIQETLYTLGDGNNYTQQEALEYFGDAEFDDLINSGQLFEVEVEEEETPIRSLWELEGEFYEEADAINYFGREVFNELVETNQLKKKDTSENLSSFSDIYSQSEEITPSQSLPPITEQDFFEGGFGDALRGFDAIVPLGIGDFIDDMTRAVAGGYNQGIAGENASDLLFAGSMATDEDIASYIEANKNAQKYGSSQEMKEYQKTYEEYGGVLGVVMGLAKSGLTILPEIMLSSFVAMASNSDALAAGGTIVAGSATAGALTAGAGASVVVPVVGTVVGAAAGAITGAAASLPYAFAAASTALEMGATFSELLQGEIDGELTPEKIKAALSNEKTYTSIRNKAVARGITIGALDMISGKVGGRIASSVLKKGARATGISSRATKIKAVAAASAVEGVGGSIGETAGIAATNIIGDTEGQDFDISEIILEGIAEIPGGVKDMVSARFSKPKYKVNGERVDAATIDSMIETMTLEELTTSKIQIDNDYEGRDAAMQDRIVTLSIENQVKKVIPNITPESVTEIVTLQKELQSLEGNKTEVGKKRASEIRGSINEIMTNETAEAGVVEVTDEAVVDRIKEIKGDDSAYTQEEFDNIKKILETENEAKLVEAQEEQVMTSTEEFRQLEQSEQIDYINKATKELAAEAEAGGQVDLEITESQALTRANQLFQDTKNETKKFRDDQVALKEETFTVTDEEGGRVVTTVVTNLDGSLRKAEVENFDADGNSLGKGRDISLADNNKVVEKGLTAEQLLTDRLVEGEVIKKTERSGNEINNPKKTKQLTTDQKQKLGIETTPKKNLEVKKQVDNAIKALKTIDNEIEVVYHTDDASYRDATNEQSREQSTNGEYNPATKTIHINGTKANNKTVAHEVFHALLLRTGITNEQAKAITDRMLEAVKKTASPELIEKLEKFSSNYESSLQSEESIAELFGLLASEYPKLDAPTQSIVKRWLDKIAKLLGVKPFTDAEVIDLLNVVSAKVEAGQEITAKDVKILGKNKSKKEIIKSRKQTASKASSVEMFENPDILQPKRMANGRTKVIELGRAFDKRAKDNGTYIPLPKNGVYTDAQLNAIAEAMTDDAQLQLLQDDSGIGWYDLKTKSAMELMSRIHPELSDSNSKPHLEFTLMVALISQNNSVGINFRQANEAYTYYKNNNKLPNRKYAGKSGNIIKQNIALALEAIEKKGWENYKNTLQETKTVKEWEAEGYKVNGENKTTKITGAMAMLGSKIGSFWGNLNGDFDTLTADLWFSRMFNRYTGNVVAKDKTKGSKKSTLSAIDSYKGSELLYGFNKAQLLKGGKTFDKWLNTIAKNYADGGYKSKIKLNIVSNTHFKNLAGSLQDLPRGGNERNTMRDVVKRVQGKLIERGFPKLDIADIQAIVWYNEKDLYRLYKAVNKSSEKTDYETAAQEVLREQGVNAEVALPFQRSKSSTDGGRNQTDTVQSKGVSSKVASPQSRKQIIGENADLTALNLSYSLNLAKEIEQVQKLSFREKIREAKDRDILDLINKTPQELRYMTGWERGIDGKWRYELPDGKLSLRETGKFKLSDIYDSKELYDAYPQLKDMKVEVDIRQQGAVSAWFIPSSNSIEINAKPDSDVTSLLIHEVQHAIQFVEGFATGGNMMSAFEAYENTVTPEEKQAELELKEEVEVLRDLSTVLEMADVEFEGMSVDEVFNLDFMQSNWEELGFKNEGDAIGVYEYVNSDNPQIMNQLKTDEYGDSLDLSEAMDEAYGITGEKQAEYSDKYSTYALYQRLAGEVESRNVEKRYEMREETRRKTLLSATEDVAREDQILLFPDQPQSRKQQDSSKEVSEIEGEIEQLESEIENKQEEIAAEKSDTKDDIQKKKDEIAKVKKSKKSPAKKRDLIEDIKEEIEDIKEDGLANIEYTIFELKELKQDLKKQEKKLAKLKAKPAPKPTPKPKPKPKPKKSEVEVDNEVVYEMNKTDKKTWSKDFEIIDNRNGLELGPVEENGKWAVRNKITGEMVTVGTKKDARNIIDNAPSYAKMFGDGTKVDNEAVVSPETTPKAKPAPKSKKSDNTYRASWSGSLDTSIEVSEEYRQMSDQYREKNKQLTLAALEEVITTEESNKLKIELRDNLKKAKLKFEEAKSKPAPKPKAKKILEAIPETGDVTAENKITIADNLRAITKGVKTAVVSWMRTSKFLAQEIGSMVKSGRITVKQSAAILKKFSGVNMFNEASIDRFVDFMARVINNAEYAEQLSTARKNIKRAKKNIRTKIGSADAVVPMLSQIFDVNPSLIPESVWKIYTDLVADFSGSGAVISPSNVESVSLIAGDIIDSLNAEFSQTEELGNRYDAFDKVLDKKTGAVDYAATIKKMENEGVITPDELSIMSKYRTDIAPPTPKTPKTKAEIQAEKDAIIKDIKGSPTLKISSINNKLDRAVADRFVSLMATPEVLESMSLKDLQQIQKLMDNINNGYLPHLAQVQVEKMSSVLNSNILTSAIQGSKLLPASAIYGRLKSLVTKRGAISEMIRRNPLFYIDQIFGDFKTKDIFNSVFNQSAIAQERYQADIKKIFGRIDKAQNSVAKTYRRNPNGLVRSKFKQMIYSIQLEAESNLGNPEVNQAGAYIKKTIEAIMDGKTTFTKRDADMLNEIYNEFEVNGEIDINKLYDSFSKVEKASIKEIQDINIELQEKAVFTSAVIRGDRMNPRNNYTHLNVITAAGKDNLAAPSEAQKILQSLRPSTKANSLIERTGNVAPLNFDYYASASRGAKGVLLDFYMTEPIRTTHRTLDRTKDSLKDGSNMMPGNQREKFNAIRDSFDEVIGNLYVNAFTQNGLGDAALKFMNRNGYRAILASSTRWMAELTSNTAFALITNPRAFTIGAKIGLGFLNSDAAPKAMKALGSKQTTRIYPSDSLSGRMVDTNLMNQAQGEKGGRVKGRFKNKMTQIWNLTGAKYAGGVATVSDALISTPDKIVMRPMWFGSFSAEFQKITGQKPDFDKIASEDSAYMSENAAALKDATTKADETSVMTGSTANPFMGILKGQSKPEDGLMTKAFNNFNTFMTTFLIYEYVTARTGIVNAVGGGVLGKAKGAQLLAGSATRMITYTMLATVLSEALTGLAGDEPEEQKAPEKQLGQAIASTVSSMMLGRDFGNVTKAVINYGIEEFNKEFLDFLREGEYDSFKDGIQYQVVPQNKDGRGSDIGDFIKAMSAGYSPFIKTIDFMIGKATEAPKVTEAARKRQQDEVMIRLPLEVLGNTGLIPLYKDVRKMVLRNLYGEMRKASNESAKRKAKELDKLQGYSSRSDMKRYDYRLWMDTFGPNSMDWNDEQRIKQERKELREAKQRIKDEENGYTGRGTKSGFGNSGFGSGGSKRKTKKKGGFGSSGFGG